MLRARQILFGYSDGHRRLAGSAHLSREDTQRLLVLSDLAPGITLQGLDAYWTGVPLRGSAEYALMCTWSADEAPRPGCVWTHCVILDRAVLGTIEELSALRACFSRPVRDQFDSYERVLEFSVSRLKPVPPRQSSAWWCVNAVYFDPTSPPQLSMEEAADCAFALWSQQWPNLRAEFSFRTATGRTSTRHEFQLDIVTRAGSKNEPTATLRAAEAWKQSIVADLYDPPSSLRSFLWEFGQDSQRGIDAFGFLAETHEASCGPRPSVPIEERLALLASREMALAHFSDEVWRSASAGSQWFKASPLGLLRLFWSGRVLAPSRQAYLQTLESSLGICAGNVAVALEDRADDAVPGAALMEDILALESRAISPLLPFLSSASLRQILQRRPSELGNIDVLWLSEQDLLAVLDESSRVPTEVFERVVARAPSREFAFEFARRHAVDLANVLLSIKPAEARATLADWSASLISYLGPTLSAACLQQPSWDPWLNLAQLLGDRVLELRLRPEIELLARLPGRMPSAMPAEFAVMLVLSSMEESRQEFQRFMELGFEPSYLALREGRISWAAAQRLGESLVTGWFSDWDYCRRLVAQMAILCLRRGFDAERFDDLAESQQLLTLLRDELRDSSAGRRFLGKLPKR